MRMEKRSVLSPLARSLITVVLSLGTGYLAGSGSLLKMLSAQTKDSSGAPAANLARGIEVSHRQGPVVWTDVRSAGFSFVWIKATESDSLLDPSYGKNRDSARQALMSIGAYHTFESERDPVKQAVHFVETVGAPYAGNLPPLLKLAKGALTIDSLKMVANEWMRAVRDSLHLSTIAYTGNAAIMDSLGPLLSEDSTLVAVYDGGCGGATGDWWYRRCTDRDSVNGVVGPVSTVVFNGTDSIFARFLKSRGFSTD